MEYRPFKGLVVLLFLVLLLPSCMAHGNRLYSLCFVEDTKYTYMEFSIHDTPKLFCSRAPPRFWHQDFPIEVVAPLSVLQDAKDMTAELNAEVGRELFTVRAKYVGEIWYNPDPGVTVFINTSDDEESYCEKIGNDPCIGYVKYRRIHGEYYAEIMLYNKLIKTPGQRRVVLKHELGHALGLKHAEMNQMDLMFSSVAPDTKPKYLSEKDRKLLRGL